jgi:hypothetical protein
LNVKVFTRLEEKEGREEMALGFLFFPFLSHRSLPSNPSLRSRAGFVKGSEWQAWGICGKLDFL